MEIAGFSCRMLQKPPAQMPQFAVRQELTAVHCRATLGQPGMVECKVQADQGIAGTW